ncbi:sulfatase/phosphatase domain-containing protein, partial [Rhodopirellula bahusiensis]
LRGVRTTKYKLIRDRHNEGCDEFYDLTSDPGETLNLIQDPSSQMEIKMLDAKLRELEAKVEERK